MASIMVKSNVDPAETERMEKLFEEARGKTISKEERAAQRLSWAYGNQPLDSGISKEETRKIIDRHVSK